MKRTTRMGTGAAATAAILLGAGVITSAPASAHGYVEGPVSRTAACNLGLNTGCGSLIYEPQSLEGAKGFPAGGPADGQIASAGGLFGGLLDQQSSDRWYKNDITTGPLLIDWKYTAPHSTAKWHYYMTKQGWDPNAPLDRGDLELITEVRHDGSRAVTNPDHTITIPADRSGYHVILAVWDIADTVNAFYNVIDVNVVGEGVADTTPPSIPVELIADDVTTMSASLDWADSTDDSGVVRYEVYRNGTLVGTTSQSEFIDTNLAPSASYEYSIVALDPSGNASAVSSALQVITLDRPSVDTVAPTVPEFLHSMGTTENSVKLMWLASSDDSGAVSYIVERDGVEFARTGMRMLTDSGLTAGTTYTYTVRAVDPSGNVSEASNQLVIATKAPVTPEPTPVPEPEPTPEPTPAPVPNGNWNPSGSYAAGDTVTYNGVTYRAVQSHTGVGDPNWITAPSLWAVVGSASEVAPQPAPEPEPAPQPAARAWSATATYSAGDRVTFGGATFEAVQSHTGVGDPNWIYAPSLWKQV
jgi:chitin-binding protein